METSLPTESAPPDDARYEPPLPSASGRNRKEKALSEFAVLLGLVGDAAVVTAVLLLGFWLRARAGSLGDHPLPRVTNSWPAYPACVAGGVIALLGCFEYHEIYRREVLLHTRNAAVRVVRATAAWLVLCAGLVFIFRLERFVSPGFLVLAGSACAGSLLAWRCVFHQILKSGTVAGHLRQRVVLLGWTPEAGKLASEVWKYETDPYEIVGYVELRSGDPAEGSETATIPYLGDARELPSILAAEQADIALLADLTTDFRTTRDLVALCEREMVQFKMIPTYFPIMVSGLHVEMVSGTPLLGVERLPLNRFGNRLLKRVFDIVGSLVGLALSLPLVLLFGGLVYLESPGPIFYRQRRLGLRGKCFGMIKIRSMRLDAEQPGKVGWTVKDDPRRLKIGTLMRKWNIDEVPQFWNVLKGEMSLVGPRPERPELIEDFKYDIAHYNARHFIKPGLTGWAQVNGLRGDTDLSERIRHDLHYIEHWNLWLDVRAVILTFLKRQNAC